MATGNYTVSISPSVGLSISASNSVQLDGMLDKLEIDLRTRINDIASSFKPYGTVSVESVVNQAISDFYYAHQSKISSITVSQGDTVVLAHDSSGLKSADKSSGEVTLKAKGDGVTDDTQAFLDALASNSVVIVPKPTDSYKVTAPIIVPAGKSLIGDGLPQIKYFGTMAGGVGVIQSGGAGAIIKGFKIDGGSTNTTLPAWPTYGVKVSHDNVIVQDVDISNHRSAGFYFQGATGSKLKGGSAKTTGAGPGISVQQCYRCEFVDTDVTGNLSNFGCYVFESHYNLFQNLKALNKGTNNVSLELIGMTYSCSHNKIIGCRAEGTGDNGISVTGSDNEVIGNHAEECKHAGIYVYGSRNTVVGNHCQNNNQRFTGDATAKFAGIMVQSSWGGLGAYNTVVGNVCIDTQTTHTQYAAVRLANHSYPNYAANTAYTTNSYIANGLNVYKCVQAGTSASGGVAPTHTTGDVTDGTVIWRYVTTGDSNLNPKYNTVVGNSTLGNINNSVLNETTNAANTVLDAGTIEVAVAGSATVSTKFLTGNFSPVSPGTAAPIGSIFLRNGGGTGITAYLKEDATNAGWAALVTRKNGTFASKPNLTSAGYNGYMYVIDDGTSPPKPIWFKYNTSTSTGEWFDATGTKVTAYP